MSDAMQVLAVAGTLLAVAQVIAKLPGNRKHACPAQPASEPVVVRARL